MQYENVELTRVYDNPDFPLGAIHEDGGDVFEFVKYHSGDNPLETNVGYLSYYCSSGTEAVPEHTVTSDHDAATKIKANYAHVAGMFMAYVTNGKYGWIQKKGWNRSIMVTDGSITAGCVVTACDSDAQIRIMVNTDVLPIVGYAFADDVLIASAKGSIRLCIS